jgi:carbamoylphosphate synthase large subunit
MGIQKDAGELLAYIYSRYTQDVNGTGRADIENESKWNTGRIDRAIKYLRELDLIDIMVYLGDHKSSSYGFRIGGLTPQGIDIVEDKQKFKSTFGLEIGIPSVFKFSWKGEKK